MNDIFAAAFHHSPIGQYLLAPTDELEIMAVNDVFLRWVNRKREDLLGVPLFVAFPSNPDDATDTGVHDLRRSIQTAIRTGQSQLMPAQRYPVEMERDGKRWFEEMFWSATNTPLYDADGKLVCISHTTIDITAQVRAEQALRSSEMEAIRLAAVAEADRAYLVGVLSSAPVGIMVVDRDGKLLHENPANQRLYGPGIPYPAGQVDFAQWTGWHLDQGRDGEPVRVDQWPLYRALAGEVVNTELLKVQGFGPAPQRRSVLASAAPILGPNDELVGAVGVALDIEDRIKAEQALREADRRKDEFLAMLAHELRNPLAPIGSAAAVLSMGNCSNDTLRRTSAVITRQVQHMSGLIDELLDVARVTRGLITLKTTVLDAKQIVAEALEQARPGIEARGHMLRVSQPPMDAFVNGDRKRLVQVLVNLLNNAAKFTPEGGIVQVELVIDPTHVRMSVIDNGVGMSEEMLERAFELFVQAERSSDRAQGGLGIGLALVRSLVRLHGGNVFARSDGPGRGTRVTVCLPKLATLEPGQGGHDPHGLSAGALNVLVVDDNEDAATMLAMLISSLGHRVSTAGSGTDGLRQAREGRPDVCVLDIGLPDMDGLAMARTIRRTPELAGCVLIGASGYGQDADRAAAFEAGFDRYFVKPVDLNEFSEYLSQLRFRQTGT
jgi:signal transduction histidine kinase/CheY-like chemotaxis protein